MDDAILYGNIQVIIDQIDQELDRLRPIPGNESHVRYIQLMNVKAELAQAQQEIYDKKYKKGVYAG